MRRELKKKDEEIGEKEATIKRLEDEDSFTQESDDEDEDLTQKSGLCIGQRDTESESEAEFDLFQLEIVSDKEVYACNLCNEGFDSKYEVKEHLKQTHEEVFKLD